MASSLALKKLVSTNLLPNSLRAIRKAAPASQSASRLFNTNAVREFDGGVDDRSLDDDRRSNVSAYRRGEFAPSSFSDMFDPFSTTRSLSQILNMMDKMDKLMDSPLTAASRGMGAGLHRGWDARETEEGLYLRMDMPGLGKENVKVAVEQNTLVIKGETEESSGEDDGGRRYSSRIDLPDKLYKTDQIKAEMKNGVLKVMVPKVKEEERSDVFHVNVE